MTMRSWVLVAFGITALFTGGLSVQGQGRDSSAGRPDARTPNLAVSTYGDSGGPTAPSIADSLRALLSRSLSGRRLRVASRRELEFVLNLEDVQQPVSANDLREVAKLMRATALLDIAARPDGEGIRVNAALHWPNRRDTDSLPGFVAATPRDAAVRLMEAVLRDSRLERGAAAIADAPRMRNSDQPYFQFQVEKPASQVPEGTGPRYPDALKAANIGGEVLAQFIVDEHGRYEAGSFKVLQSSHDLFAAAVKDALPNMRFRPAEIGGQKVKSLIQHRFSFSPSGAPH